MIADKIQLAAACIDFRSFDGKGVVYIFVLE
jgi:hypothetical protein